MYAIFLKAASVKRCIFASSGPIYLVFIRYIHKVPTYITITDSNIVQRNFFNFNTGCQFIYALAVSFW